jgi:NAD(P)-dependent dehydrogenase (short-subunit alcohol dehydrogenase family)
MNKLAKFESLRGKRVFITGGGVGIGEAIVISFAKQGAQVAFVDNEVNASLALVRCIRRAGWGDPLYRQCDTNDIFALQNTMSEIVGMLGDFDILVNTAANDQLPETANITQEYFAQQIIMYKRQLSFTCDAVLEGMRKKGAGCIINVGSTSWHVKNAGYAVYAAAKAAIHGLTRGLAKEFGAHGIRVNTVTPGSMTTQRQIDLWLDDPNKHDINSNQCLQSNLMAQHVASMVLFLAANDGAMCTAQEFIVDAGWL